MNQEKTTYLSIFRQGKGTLIKFALAGFLIALIISFIQPLQYSSQASVLVIPNPKTNTDSYQATKSAENYALTLSTVIKSMSFYNKIVVNNSKISALFPADQNQQRNQWQRDFSANIVPGTGILRLVAYSRKPENSQIILASAVSVLQEEGPAYLGGKSAVLIYMIDTPIASPLPVRPNFPLNLLGGIFAGFLIGAVIVLIKSEYQNHNFIKEELPEPLGMNAISELSSIIQKNNFDHQPEANSKLVSLGMKKVNLDKVEMNQAYPEEINEQASKPKPIPRIESQEPWLTVTHQEDEDY